MFTGEFSGLFASMYVCPEHGETWDVEIVEDIDTENDEVYERRVCSKCYRDVKPLLHDGHPVLHPLTDEEAYWETSSPFSEDDDAGWGEEGSVCHRCGGEHGDGWSNCICDLDDEP